MGHMKKLLALVALSFIFASTASAHEGSIDLTGGNVSCKGVSIYQDGTYRVSGRCDGLVYPYETLYNKYVLWGKTSTRGEVTRIAEVDRGYFSGNISDEFDAMYITAEKDGLVRKMGDKQIVSGSVAAFSFDKSKSTAVPVTTTTATTTKATTTSTAATTVAATTGTAGAVIGKIVSSLLVVILVIVGLAIGASLLFRSRGSVSSH
jgi:hypothetical protein